LFGVDALAIEQRLARYAARSAPYSNDPSVLGASALFTAEYFAAVRDAVQAAFADPASLHACLAAPVDESCMRDVVQSFGARAYRRPLDATEVDELLAFFREQAEVVGESPAAQLVLRRMAGAHEVLFRREVGTVNEGSGSAQLTPHEVAELVAFTLTDGPPDAELNAAADAGTLLEKAVLEEHVKRLLTSAETAPGVSRFLAEWLELDRTRLASRPALGDGEERVLRWLETETKLFTEHVVWEDTGTLKTLLDADYTFWSSTLAKHYGLGYDPPGTPKLDTVDGRRGILMQGSFLTGHGGTTARGLFVRTKLLCQPVPDPPPGIEMNFETLQAEFEAEEGRELSPREVRARHMNDSACSSCHSAIDPLGFPFDSFDDVGLIRTSWEGGFPIDTEGEIVNTTSTDGKVADAAALVLRLAESRDVQDCFVTQLYSFVHGRTKLDDDVCYLGRLQEEFAASGGDVLGLMVAILLGEEMQVRSPVFDGE
jgi:hypothetical protein